MKTKLAIIALVGLMILTATHKPASQLNVKGDDPCTGQEDVGRCADKPPIPIIPHEVVEIVPTPTYEPFVGK